MFARVAERVDKRLEAESEVIAKAQEYVAARLKATQQESKIAASTVSKLETEVSLGLMADGTTHGRRAKMPHHTVLRLPAPPPGYRWECAPLDSGCTTVILKHCRGFKNVNPNTPRKIRVANDRLIPCDGEGTFCFTLMSKDAQLVSVSAQNAVYSSELRNLISSAVFEDMGHKVVLDGDDSHIILRTDGVEYAHIPLRCEGRLRYLDYLVPDDAKSHTADIALFGDTCFLDEITDSDTLEYLEQDKLNHFDMANEDDIAVTRLNAEPVHSMTLNLPNVRDPEYLEHR